MRYYSFSKETSVERYTSFISTRYVRYLVYLLCLLTIPVAGCLPKAKAPIGILRYPAEGKESTRTLFVFLHGYGDSPQSFAKNGFVEAVRERNKAVDMVSVDSTIGYYFKNVLVHRLREDVIAPARTQGYDSIWLVGVSLGGFGALSYTSVHPEDISGVIVLAPFLGENEILDEINRAGGVTLWEGWSGIKDEAWSPVLLWLRNYAGKSTKSPPIYLGYGSDDRYLPSDKILSGILPPDHVIVLRGGHNWRTWKSLWGLFMRRQDILHPN